MSKKISELDIMPDITDGDYVLLQRENSNYRYQLTNLLSGITIGGNYQEKEDGKGLSTNDLTDALKANYDIAFSHSQLPHNYAINGHTHDEYMLSSTVIPTSTSELINDSNFATESFVTTKITEASLGGKVDLTGYATETYVNDAISVIELKPGLKGDTGEQGPAGVDGTDGLPGKDGADGLTTSISVNGATYTHVNGLITLPNYPEIKEVDLSGYATTSAMEKALVTKADKSEIPTVTNDLTNTLKTNYDSAYVHSQSIHAPVNAQKNSDITKAEIEAKLTGNITTHTHNSYATIDYVNTLITGALESDY